MNAELISAVTKVANAIYKKKGYAGTIKEEDAEIVLEAEALLVKELNKGEIKCLHR